MLSAQMGEECNCLMKRIHEKDIVGRGISYMDAIELDINGEIKVMISPEKYRTGALKMMRSEKRVIPLITFADNNEEHLCIDFQRKLADGRYVDYSLEFMVRALSLYIE